MEEKEDLFLLRSVKDITAKSRSCTIQKWNIQQNRICVSCIYEGGKWMSIFYYLTSKCYGRKLSIFT